MRVAQHRMSSSASHQALQPPTSSTWWNCSSGDVEKWQNQLQGFAYKCYPFCPDRSPSHPLQQVPSSPPLPPVPPGVGPSCPLDTGLWQSEQGGNLLLGASCTLHTGLNKETGTFQTIKMIDNDKQSVIGRTTARQFTQVSLDKVKSYMRVSEVVISAMGT